MTIDYTASFLCAYMPYLSGQYLSGLLKLLYLAKFSFLFSSLTKQSHLLFAKKAQQLSCPSEQENHTAFCVHFL